MSAAALAGRPSAADDHPTDLYIGPNTFKPQPIVPRKVIVIVVVITSLLFIKSQLPQFTAYDDSLLYSDTHYWEWTQADENVLTGVRKVELPTQEQLKYWATNPPPASANERGAAEIMQFLVEHQYPRDCSNKKFLVYRLTKWGIGSDLHVMTWALGVAIETGRILIYDPDQSPWRWADRDFCGSLLLPDCYLKQLSNCSLPKVAPSDIFEHKWGPVVESPRVVYFEQRHDFYTVDFIPEIMRKRFPAEGDQRTWWRTVTTQFVWRPNARFQQFLDQVDIRLFGGVDRYPQRALGIHVRHGDKAQEMTLHDLPDYLDAAEKLKKDHSYLGMSNVVILSTEDLDVIDKAERWNSLHPNTTQWQFIYLNDAKKNNQWAVSATRWHFVNAFLAARADAWVLTTASNWCRLINEIRKTTGKYNHALVDLEYGLWRKRESVS
eukprot:TRINITY_DN7551_c0_g1_i1.p1 TRINITY_DN7551_c0_g1~~TRINITY_DN7551_c0_g1_i1.p1  ORF type:complete len:437 (+),score=49.75 TRINITY_DN7551_c0_g1_i1:64-1374(+)